MVRLRPGSPDSDPSAFTADTELSGGVISQHLTQRVEIAGQEFLPTKIKVEKTRYSEAGRAEIVGLWEHPSTPNSGEELTININGVRVFTGDIEQVNDKSGDRYNLVAFDGIKEMMKTSITQTFDQAEILEVVNYIEDHVSIEIESNFGEICQVSPKFNGESALSVVDQISKWGNLIWWVNEYNELIIGEADPTIYEFGPELIEDDPDASKKRPPYHRVIVEGGATASKSRTGKAIGGSSAYHVLSKRPVTAIAGEGQPTYRYKSKQIITERQAQNAANAILQEFKRQRAQGTVGIVGEGAPLRPFDVMQMPEELDDAKYLVSGVKHTFSNDEGFITDVDCGGLIDG